MKRRLNLRSRVATFFLVGLILLVVTYLHPPSPHPEQVAPQTPSPTDTWQPINDGLPGYAFVTTIVVLPPASDGQATILAGAYEPVGVYRSDDGGRSWHPSAAGLDGAGVFTLVRDLHISFAIYAGTVDGIYRSTDSGHTWQRCGNAQGPIYTLLFDDRRPGFLYAGTIGAVFQSSDGGESWTQYQGGLVGTSVLSLAFCGEPRALCAGTNGKGIMRSTNGVQWTSVYPTTTVVSSVIAHPRRNEYLLARAQDRLMRSTDGGVTWEAVPSALQGQLLGLAFDPSGEDVVYALTAGRGVQVSRDGGATWQRVGQGLDDQAVYALTIADHGPYRLLAGTVHGIWGMSADGDWVHLGGYLGAPIVRDLAITAGGDILAGTTDGLFRRRDGQWQVVGGRLSGVHVLAVAPDPRDDHRIILGTWFHGVQVSRDGGGTWTQTTDKQFANSIIPRVVVDRHNPGNVYARVEYARLLISRDGGNTWSESSLPITVTVFSIAVAPTDSDLVYVGTDRGIYRFHDSGQHWQALSAQPAADSILALLVHPKDRSVIIAGSEGGIYHSSDEGRTWEAAHGIGDATVTILVADPRHSHVIYAGTRYNGVFVSTDGGATWAPLGRGLEQGSVNALVLDPGTGTLYAASETGVYRLASPVVAGRPASVAAPADKRTLPRATSTVGEGISLAMHTLRVDSKLMALIHEAGFDSVVQVVPWRDVEPEKGRYRWEFTDAMMRAAEFYGLELVLRVDFQPLWARNTWANAPPERAEDYGDFVHALASRYRGRVKGYVIWNEPNLALEWGGERPDPQGYAALLKVVYQRIKEADPQALVVSAGLAPTNEHNEQAMDDRAFLQALYTAGAGAYFDVLGAHPYGFGNPPDDPYGAHDGLNYARLQDLRAIMEANGDTGKPVWITEIGWTTEATDSAHVWQAVSEDEQAAYLVQAVEKTRRDWPWVRLIAIWNLSVGLDPGDQMRGYSIVGDGYRKKPAYDALQQMAARWKGGRTQTDVEEDRAPERIEILAPDVVIHLGDQDYLVWPWVPMSPRQVPVSEWSGEFFVHTPGHGTWTLTLDGFQLNEWGNRIEINGQPLEPRFLPGRVNDWAGYWTRVRLRVPSGILHVGSNWLTVRTSMNAPVHQTPGISWEDLQIRNISLTPD